MQTKVIIGLFPLGVTLPSFNCHTSGPTVIKIRGYIAGSLWPFQSHRMVNARSLWSLMVLTSTLSIFTL